MTLKRFLFLIELAMSFFLKLDLSDKNKKIKLKPKTLGAVGTAGAPKAIGPYSQAILCDDYIFTSGQIAINPESGQIEETDIKGQTHQVMRNLDAVLLAAGSDFSNVIKTTCYLKSMDDFAAFNEVYGSYFTGKPARSCVEAAKLPKDALVEIELVALSINN